MVLISKDRVHIKGDLAECLCDFGMLSATIEKRYGISLDHMKEILELAHKDLVAVDNNSQQPKEAETISIVFTRGRDIFNL